MFHKQVSIFIILTCELKQNKHWILKENLKKLLMLFVCRRTKIEMLARLFKLKVELFKWFGNNFLWQMFILVDNLCSIYWGFKFKPCGNWILYLFQSAFSTHCFYALWTVFIVQFFQILWLELKLFTQLWLLIWSNGCTN